MWVRGCYVARFVAGRFAIAFVACFALCACGITMNWFKGLL